MKKRVTPKAILSPLFLILAILGVACEKDQLEGDCVMGMIPENTVYKMRYGDCYLNSVWVEVLSNKNLGKDVTIHHPSPILHPIEPDKYFNIVELIFTDDFITDRPIAELAGKRIYFKHRQPTEEELKAAHSGACAETYRVHQTSIVIVMDWSFDRCPTIP